MKKMFGATLPILLFFVSMSASAQSGSYIIGLETGLGLHRLRFSDSYQDGFSQITGVSYNTLRGKGLSGGIRVGYYFSDNFSILLTPYFLQKKTPFETSENGTFEFEDRQGNPFTAVGFVKWEEQYSDLHIPLQLRFEIPVGDRFAFTLGGGPCMNLYFKGKGEAAIVTQEKTIPVDDYTMTFGKARTNDYSNTNFSVVFAPGVMFKFGDQDQFRVTAEVRFDHGLRDMYTENRKNFLEDGGVDILGTRKMSSTVFNLGFEYRIETWK